MMPKWKHNQINDRSS